MAACNNTTYISLVLNSTELLVDYHRYAFIVNVLEYNVPVAMSINKVVTIIWTIVGVFGNSLSAFVWANPHMRTCNTAAYYLTSLAIADLTFLIFNFIYELENPWLVGTLNLIGWCQIFNVVYMSVQYLCVFLVFAFTVERFLSICYPFKSERFGKTRTPRTIVGLIMFALLLGLPQAYFWEFNTMVSECKVRSKQSINTKSFFFIYTWISELAVFGVLPLTVLILNSAVLFKIRSVGKLNLKKVRLTTGSTMRAKNRFDEGNSLVSETTSTIRSKQFDKRSGHANNRRGEAKSHATNTNHSGTTITLLWVSFYLIVTMLPNTIVYSLQQFVAFGPLPCQIEDMANHPTWQTYFKFLSIKLIIKEISLSHHVGNIFIYIATSRRFLKLVLKNLIHHRKSRNPKDGNDTSLHIFRNPSNDHNHV